MKILVCGSREAPESIKEELSELIKSIKPSLIIHGAARGADSHADFVAKFLEIPVKAFPANWKKTW